MEGSTKCRFRVDLRHIPTTFIGGGVENILEKEADLEETWREFLENEVGLDLRGVGANEVIVCNHTFVRNPHKKTGAGAGAVAPKKTYGSPGWCANLDDKVKDFVLKYRKTLPAYSIRVLPGGGNGGGIRVTSTTTSPASIVPPQTQRPRQAGKTYRVPPPPPPPPPPGPIRGGRQARSQGGLYGRIGNFGGGGGDVPPIRRPSSVRGAVGGNPQLENFLNGFVPQEGAAGVVGGRRSIGGDHGQQQRNVEVEVEGDDKSSEEEGDGGEDGGIDYDDTMSEGTALVEEERELRAEGIPMDFIKAEAVRRLSRMDNSILLKARKEVDVLREDARWFKNVKRAPFCCFVIEELLRAPPQPARR